MQGKQDENKFESASILIAEDNPANQRIATRFLEKHGCRVTVVQNGAEAVNAFQEGAFDIILMDIHMPEMDGLEATARIRQLQQGMGVRPTIIAYTALASPEDREMCLRAGMDDHLSKPINRRTFIETISMWITAAHLRSDGQVGIKSPTEETLPDFIEDRELLNELLGDLRESIPGYLEKIRLGISASDSEMVRVAAHTLKGCFSNFGKNAATKTAAELEILGKNSEFSAATAIYDRLTLDIERLIQRLTDVAHNGDEAA